VLDFAGDAATDLSHRYLWGPAVDQILADEGVDSLTSAGDILWPLTDHLGTTRDLAEYDSGTDTTTIASHRIFDSFGNLISETNGSITILFGFTARPFDVASGLQWNLNRWYIPTLGVWMSEDPIGFAAGDVNVRRYVSNSPAMALDPDGLDFSFWDSFYSGFYHQGYPYHSAPGTASAPAVPPAAASNSRPLSDNEHLFISEIISAIYLNKEFTSDPATRKIELGKILDNTHVICGATNGTVHLTFRLNENVAAITLNGYIYFRKQYYFEPIKPSEIRDAKKQAMLALLVHEAVHSAQQATAPGSDLFYSCYLFEARKGYKKISSEIEAYAIQAAALKLLERDPTVYGRPFSETEQAFVRDQYEKAKAMLEAD
jgi:RHS repeat-associated protein